MFKKTHHWISTLKIRDVVIGVFCLLLGGMDSPLMGEENTVSVEAAFPNLIFDRPVDFQSDTAGRLYVVEQAGMIRIFENRKDEKTSLIFLDIRSRVDYNEGEQGLLGLAFHPDFKKNGYFYVNYTAPDPLRTVISRFQVNAKNPREAVPGSEVIILEFVQPYSNHNGGQIAFGPDGFLYIATGDGGSANDPHGNGQNVKTLLGKILRIDVNHQEPGKKYAIPDNNPFCGSGDGVREEIFAYGMRNPWRMSFDRKGRLWAADVGQDRIEEIDLIEKGKNYGWNVMEGSHCFNPSQNCVQDGLTLPVAEYTHEVGMCITGGYVYEGQSAPSLRGAYICADYVTGRFWALRSDDGTGVVFKEFLKTDLNVSSFGVDDHGEQYICAFDGRIYRFTQAGQK